MVNALNLKSQLNLLARCAAPALGVLSARRVNLYINFETQHTQRIKYKMLFCWCALLSVRCVSHICARRPCSLIKHSIHYQRVNIAGLICIHAFRKMCALTRRRGDGNQTGTMFTWLNIQAAILFTLYIAVRIFMQCTLFKHEYMYFSYICIGRLMRERETLDSNIIPAGSGADDVSPVH